ncbi:MAG: 2-hydroxyacid dehydrogenase [Spirochaetes bacterium]|nr:2-hydroxyacid dehydrogenase [Spirochaetota bacterium]
MRIGFFMPPRSVWDGRIQALRLEFPEHDFIQGLLPEAPELPILDLIVAMSLPRESYLASPSLKAIFQPLTGVNHLPLAELAERGIRVFNVHANAFDVAERALAMTLAFYGRVVEYHNDLKASVWHGLWVKGGAKDNWDSLRGKSCAILGTGAIGVELAKLLKAFSCKVYGWRRRTDQGIPEGFDAVLPDLVSVIEKAEIVFLALPLTPATEGLISREVLASMKGKFLVNVGRGSLVDEKALYEALRDGVLKGAAIDTWYLYPQSGRLGSPSRYAIQDLPNVILSPHVGGSTNQAAALAVDRTMANLIEYLSTGNCSCEVDLRAAY